LPCPRNDGSPCDPGSLCVADQANGSNRDTRYSPAQPVKDDALEKWLSAYRACVSSTDAHIGMVLDAVDRAGLASDAIIMIFSDRGFDPGPRGRWGSRTLFERSTRVPLLMRIPGVTRRQVVCDEIVELVDVLPTLCELVMMPTPDGIQGRSLVPLLRDPMQPWKRAAFTVCATRDRFGRSVRTKRWRYTDWQATGDSRREFELYDLDTDPLERINLATDPGYRNERTILANLLQRGWRAAR
jgi:iduronate 2-sulfatase